MFFQNLKPLLEGGAQLAVTIVPIQDGTLTVIVMPSSKGTKDAALATPLSLTGTAEELDAEFATLLSSYVGARKSLIEQVEATTTVLEAAKNASQKKATDALTGKGTKSSSKPEASPPVEEEKDEGDDDVPGDNSSEKPAPAPAPAATDTTNLWD